jgi:hypothetical protein
VLFRVDFLLFLRPARVQPPTSPIGSAAEFPETCALFFVPSLELCRFSNVLGLDLLEKRGERQRERIMNLAQRLNLAAALALALALGVLEVIILVFQ